MSLYGDIAVVPGGEKPASAPTSAASLSSIKLLQDHLRIKQREKREGRQQQQARRPVHTPGTRLTGESVLLPTVRPFGDADFKSTGSLLGGDWDVGQEYDPFRPNDYDKVVRDRREARKKSEQIQVTAKKRLVGPYTSDDDDEEDGDAPPAASPFATAPTKPGAAIPPPKDLTTSSDPLPSPSLAPNTGSSSGGGSFSSTAAKIMQRMGYKEGAGLGKEEQGMAKPLQVSKVGVREGKILTADQADATFQPPPPVLQPAPEPSAAAAASAGTSAYETAKITAMMRNPTKVVLLTNMVGPGEVDEDLEPETKEECGKYGDVVQCLIFEMPGPAVRPEDAVRIFIEFKRIESAIKAVVDLNGRFFGGRLVRASFFDLERFRRLDLVDK